MIASFPGTVLVISHDRALLDGLCDVFLVLEGDGAVSEWRGSFAELRDAQAAKREARRLADGGGEAAPDAPLDKAARKRLQEARKEVKRIESSIERTESRIEEVDQRLHAAGADIELAMEIQRERAGLDEKLEELYARYADQDAIIEGLLHATSSL